MSYSIGVRAATKSLALAALAASFDTNVLPNQPVHQADKAQALAAAESMVNTLADDDSKDVSISLNGSLSWENAGDNQATRFVGASVGASAYLQNREEPKAA
jgi:hypothetical protein